MLALTEAITILACTSMLPSERVRRASTTTRIALTYACQEDPT